MIAYENQINDKKVFFKKRIQNLNLKLPKENFNAYLYENVPQIFILSKIIDLLNHLQVLFGKKSFFNHQI